MSCQKELMADGKPYPRTCVQCGLGPCKGIVSTNEVLASQPMPPLPEPAINPLEELRLKIRLAELELELIKARGEK